MQLLRIPLVRGASRSRPAEAVLAEIRAASRRATARSCSPASTSAATATAARLSTCPARPRGRRDAGLERLRLSSIEINHVNEALIRALRETPTASRHLHVPLQSGDDGVLRAMGRRYSAATYLRRLAPLRDEFNLTSDVIVGFPAEDERAFENTLARRRGGRPDEGARLPVLAAAGHGHGRRDRCRRR